jgi:hypothetical protein
MSGPRHADRPSHTDPSAVLGSAVSGPALNPDALEVAPGRQHEAIQGWVPQLATEDDLRIALEKAFDYRGDVSIALKSGATISGYVYDRITGQDLDSSFVRVIPANGGSRQKIRYADIAALEFSGRDTAAGKSWEAWVKKYWEKKAAGQTGIGLEPESLE